ncbi:uncharacterized protein LOC125666908 isoform X2 [Ostrea edulis]|uniref:uncharacterized protein LOC125666908 isoform X2 n=1 Tax=Ostrea edulis TaxID=37623 RepID=UPI0024AFC2D0|nr:uncharacterized protein LOC125666908 isoform X2 [Ostrea edulis]
MRTAWLAATFQLNRNSFSALVIVVRSSIQMKFCQVVEDQDDLDHDAEGIVLDAVVADDEDGMLIRQNADENDIVADHNVENHEQAPVEGVDLLEAGGSDDLFNVGELQDLSYDANTSFSYIKDVDDIGSQEMPLTTNRTKNLFILIFSRTFQRIIGQ